MNDHNVKCSVIIPLYNGERFIRETIKSCISQTLAQLEVIVVDDCSKDASLGIVRQLALEDKKIRFYRNEVNLGLSKTVNRGVSVARGDYILVIGHDDLLRTDHVEIMLEEFESDTAFVHCNSMQIDQNGKESGFLLNDKDQVERTEKFLLYSSFFNPVGSTGTVIRKSAFETVGGWDEKYRNFGEWLLWIKLACVGKVKYTTRTYAYYRRHQTNMTNTFSDQKVKAGLKRFKAECRRMAANNIKNRSDRLLRRYILFKNWIRSLGF